MLKVSLINWTASFSTLPLYPTVGSGLTVFATAIPVMILYFFRFLMDSRRWLFSVVSGQGVGSQWSGVGSQWSGVGSQWSGVGSQWLGVDSQWSLIHYCIVFAHTNFCA